jgi:hypothetical protein
MKKGFSGIKSANGITSFAGVLVFRIDAFLSNIVEFLFIGLFILIVNRFAGLFAIASQSIAIAVILSVLSSHFIYSIVYIINDFVDYPHIQKNQNNSDSVSYSFYKFRPLMYFARRKILIVCLSALYLLFLSIAIIEFSNVAYAILGAVVWFFFLSLLHSYSRSSKRVFSFFLLRLSKYFLFTLILASLLSSLNGFVFAAFALPLIIPYLTYESIIYYKERHLSEDKNSKNFKILLSILAGALIVLTVYVFSASQLLNYPVAVFLASVIAGYLIVVIPFLGVRTLSHRFFGSKNLDFTVHIKRLLTGALMAAIITICEILTLM